MFHFIEIRVWRMSIVHCMCLSAFVLADIEYNTINEDGSYRFRHTNDDIGGFYHSAVASPDNIVRGRYGSRNPASGKIDETVYTAGPRGFRANGPKIHRKMDLAQYPPRQRGSPDDPLADPFDDPSYSFSFRTVDQSRTENNDATNRVRGLYSYIDDVGERHSVRYAAGAGTGFEISNAVPDNPINVGYTNPLYKAHPTTRGKMAVQRGPSGSYKLIAAGPDHRRAESRQPDGLVRGTYSFLDDKGVQRTVEYIAGAGIGYRIVKNSIGPGTHINPSVADIRLTDTDFRLASDFGSGAGGSLALGGGLSTGSGSSGSGRGSELIGGGGSGSTSSRPGGSGASVGNGEYLKTAGSSDETAGGNGNFDGANNSITSNRKTDRIGTAAASRGSSYHGGNGSSMNNNGANAGERGGSDRSGVVSDKLLRNRPGERNGRPGGVNRSGSSNSAGGSSNGYLYDAPSTGSSNNYDLNDDDVVGSLPPLVTTNRRILEIDRERDWVQRHRDSTIIKNVGKWYVSLPPGHSVRAHVQNIDLLPLGGRILSPSEALRQDEIADFEASREH